MRKSHFVLVLLSVMLTMPVVAGQRHCTDSEAQHAEDESDTLRSWNSLHSSFILYRQCDDGATGEGYSESVARILVDHWSTLSAFVSLSKKDAGFRQFVLNHIDATLDVDDLEKIRKDAQTRCPPESKDLCIAFVNRANSALLGLESTH